LPTLRCTNDDCEHEWFERSQLAVGSECPLCDSETRVVTDWDEPAVEPTLAVRAQQRAKSGIKVARARARRLLEHHEVTEPPIDVRAIARALDKEIRERPALGSLRGRLQGDVIEVPTGDHEYVKRFSIAHELGHVVLETRHEDGSPAEREANAFASELLVPGDLLQTALRKETSIEALIRVFQVSRPVLKIAAQCHGLHAQLTP
jgi:hypothetical protein